MNEHPIIFSSEMVRAILAGKKTLTRRVLKPQPSKYFSPIAIELYNPVVVDKNGEEQPGPEIFGVYSDEEGYKFPYGQPGDRLWVREAFGEIRKPMVFYKADFNNILMQPSWFWLDDEQFRVVWKPSIHMPRWACRIILEIVMVGVERLQDMTPLDAVWEGCSADRHSIFEFKNLWNSFNAKRGFGWDVNPWVWVIKFKVVS